MFEIAVMNPRRASKRSKRRSKSAVRMKRNAKGRFTKRASNPRKKRRHNKRASNPRKHRKHVKHRRASNPRRKRHRKHNPHRHVKHRRRSNPRSHRRHRRHNPRFLAGLQGGIVGTLKEGATMGAGALLQSVILGYALPMLPTTFTTGYALSAVRITGATLFKMVAKRFGGRIGSEMGTGALAVAMYLLFRDVLVSMAPTLPLGDYEEIAIDSTSDQIGAYMDPATRLSGFLPDGSRARGTGAYLGAYMSGMEKVPGNDGQGYALNGFDDMHGLDY
jgi:hypothetical protein